MAYITKYLTMVDLNENKILILNALSGAVDLIDNDIKNKILDIKNSNEIKFSDTKLIENLKGRGYLFDSINGELEIIEKIKDVYKNFVDNKTLSFVICPTTACNLRCPYCFESEEVRSNKTVMSKSQIDVIFKNIEKIKNERNAENINIQLFGGEPLLKITKEINQYIFEKAQKYSIPVSIISNGTNIIYYEDLLSTYSNLISNIQITIDGPLEIHNKRRIRIDKSGTFKEIVAGIDILLKNNIRTSVRINVDNENINYMEEFVEFIEIKNWKENEYFHCDIAPVTDHHNSNKLDNVMKENEIVKKMMELFPNYNSKNSIFRLSMFRVLNHVNKALGLFNVKDEAYSMLRYCEANSLQYYVFTPDGKIYACPETIGLKAGEIGKFDKEMILYSESIKKWNGRNIYNIEKCSDCEIAPFCGGGCAYAALSINGDISEPICDNAKEVLEAYILSIKDYILKKYD